MMFDPDGDGDDDDGDDDDGDDGDGDDDDSHDGYTVVDINYRHARPRSTARVCEPANPSSAVFGEPSVQNIGDTPG